MNDSIDHFLGIFSIMISKSKIEIYTISFGRIRSLIKIFIIFKLYMTRIVDWHKFENVCHLHTRNKR